MKTIVEVNKSLHEKMGRKWHELCDISFEKSNDKRPPNIICYCVCGLSTFFYEPDFHWCIAKQNLLETFSCGANNPDYCSESSPRSLLNEVEAEIIKRGKQADYERAIITKGLNMETVDNLWFRLLNAPAEIRARAAEEVL